MPLEEIAFKCNECGSDVEVEFSIATMVEILRATVTRCNHCNRGFTVGYNGTTLWIDPLKE